MASLTDAELAEIQEFVDQTIESLDGLGLKISVDDDLSNWKRHLEQAPGSIGVSRTLDPAVNDLRPGNSFWVFLVDDTGEVVACQADRFVITEDFVRDYVRTHRLFGDRLPVIGHYPLKLGADLPCIAGRVSFGGGTWVHPNWRGHNLGGVVSRLGRLFSVRHFLVDYFTGFIKTGRNFGFECGLINQRKLISGRYPGREGEQEFDLFWMSKDEIIAQLGEEMRQVMYDNERQVSRLA